MIVLTGANRGIGYEIGKLLSRTHVVIGVTRDDIRLDYPCIQIQHDITQDASVLFEEVCKYVTPSVLINCAGVGPNHPDVIDVNLTAQIKMTAEFIKRTNSGRVIQIGSFASIEPNCQSDYSAAKAGIKYYIDCMRKQHRSHAFTTVLPGYTMTDMLDFVPDFRVLSPQDVAEAVQFVVSRPTHVDIREIVLTPKDQI